MVWQKLPRNSQNIRTYYMLNHRIRSMYLFNTKYMAFSSQQKHEIEGGSCSQPAYRSNGAQMVKSYGI